ncbi:hypothetical protein Cgig2_025884 [Carnegiea gigantea]|uniref:Uncharacterized protein n=1 Tax=Carnegiea gigantea TaxID=171969 RepID=A0A9Q1QCG2_9CARY|nr:hypothetical protein Cgig2_025884 [Carnegiea gigantea]
MAFPRSLDTKAMCEVTIRRFQWDRRGEVFPSSPFPKDFRSLCPDFDLATAEQAAAHYELPELPQAIFYAILLNEAEKLSILHGPRFQSLEVALTELRWGPFELWTWLFSDRVYEAWFRPKSNSGEGAKAGCQGESSSGGAAADDAAPEAFSPTHSTREMANYVKETFTWRWRSASRPPRPLSENFNVLCPYFSLAEAEATAAESGLPEIVQATFYAMLLNEMLELGVVHEYTDETMRSSLVDLRWSTFEVWMRIMDEVIREAQIHRQPDEVGV